MGLVSIKVYTKKNMPRGWKGSSPARDRAQAFSIARSYPKDMPSIVVKTGKRGEVYPYSIYVKEMFGDKKATLRLRKRFKVKRRVVRRRKKWKEALGIW